MIKRLIVLPLAFSAVAAASHIAGQTPPTVDKSLAPRLAAAVERIEKAPVSAKPRPHEFSEAELNAYLAWRLEQSKEDLLRDVRLKLYPDNRVEGWIDLDFRGRDIPPWIKERINLYFEGTLEVQPGQARFAFHKLFLEKEPMPMMMLDMIIYLASQMGKTDAQGVEDWQTLPAAVQDIRTGQARLTVWY
jgi:hypothetical protein